MEKEVDQTAVVDNSIEEQTDLSELEPSLVEELIDLKYQIKEEIESGGEFATSGWKLSLGVLRDDADELSAYGRQLRRIYKKMLPPAILEREKTSEN